MVYIWCGPHVLKCLNSKSKGCILKVTIVVVRCVSHATRMSNKNRLLLKCTTTKACDPLIYNIH